MSVQARDGVSARVYGPGLPAPGVRAFVLFEAHTLCVRDARGEERRADYDQLVVRPGGWSGQGLLLEWETAQQTFSIAIDDADQLRDALVNAPEALRRRIADFHMRARRGRNLLRLLVALAFLLLLVPIVLLGVGIVQSDRLLDAAVDRLPPSWEQQVGELVARSIAETETVRDSGPAAVAVEQVATRLQEHLDLPATMRVFLVENPASNAYAVPGGVVVVWTGLLREMERAEELAGVLAHEFEHVRLRHSTRAVVRSMGLRFGFMLLFGGHGELAGYASDVVGNLDDMKFSRQQEFEADDGAVRLLRAARIETGGMVEFFERTSRSRGKQPLPFFSTHPESNKRAARVRAAMTTDWPYTPLAIDWEAVQRDAGSTPESSP